MKPQVYLASGWFNSEQMKQMREVYDVLHVLETEKQIELFAPYYDGIVLKRDDPDLRKKMKLVWWLDINQLCNSQLVVACTQDHDVGTIFECGYASAHRIPIVCYNSNTELGLNVMLAQESRGFCKSGGQLHQAMSSFITWYHKLSKPEELDNPWSFNTWEGEPI